MWKRCRSTAKRYPGDNRLIVPKSPYRRHCLAPRCRLIASWGRSRSQGLGCSPIKAVRELGLERRSLRLHGAICGCPPAHIGETLTVNRTSGQGNTEGRPAIKTLNYSKIRSGFSAADVEQHLRSKGWLVPVTTSPIPLDRGDGSPATWQSMRPITRRPPEMG